MLNEQFFFPSRRLTESVRVGNIYIGGNHSIAVQSMCNTRTSDVQGSVKQILELKDAGADLVRLTVPTLKDVESLKEIHHLSESIPLCADVHFNAAIAFCAVNAVEKVRVNPGNFSKEEEVDVKFTNLLNLARERGCAIRVGVNHGSLSSYMMDRWGDTPEGMVQSAMEFLRIAKREKFKDIVVSLKSSNPRVMVESYRLCVRRMEEENMFFPLHLGVTEAGEGTDGRIRSSVGIGALLADGIGDTIRVSLTEDPVAEIPVARLLAKHFEKIWQNNGMPQYENLPPLVYNPLVFNRLHKIEPIVVGIGGDYERGDETWFYVNSILDFDVEKMRQYPDTPIVVSSNQLNWVGDIRYIISSLKTYNVVNPIILRKNYNLSNSGDVEVISAAEMGAILIDGIADGIWIENNGELLAASLGYSILQATRLKITRAEIISCPGCGRTQYDLQSVAKAVKERFSSFKGVKIAVMGCIVNGPGEMADADWGYVGAGGGKVTIYKGHEPIIRNVDQSMALDLLENMIREEKNR